MNDQKLDRIGRALDALTTEYNKPAAPSGVVAVATASQRVDLSWVDNSDNETNFVVERSGDLSVTVGPDVVSFVDLTVAPQTTYTYTVKAQNAFDVSASAPVSVTTPAGSSLPVAPSNLVVTSPNWDRAELTWQDNSTDETAFLVERKLSSESTFAVVATLNPGAVAYTDTPLFASTSYNYRISAVNATGSSPSFIASVTTAAAPPPPPPTRPVITVAVGQSIQAAIDSAPVGALLKIAPGTYSGFNVTTAGLTLQPDTTALDGVTRVDPSMIGALVKVNPVNSTTYPIRVSAANVELIGMAPQTNGVLDSNYSLLYVLAGGSGRLDRILALGNTGTASPLRRGIYANGGQLEIVGCYIDHIYHTNDAQAILRTDSNGPLLIDNCYLSASGETVMLGGADPASIDLRPAGLTLRNSTLTKRQEWRGVAGITVKNVLEFKNIIGGLIENNVINTSWSGSQNGVIFVLTPRNQSGTAPWSGVQDLTIRQNIFTAGGTALTFQGSDNLYNGSLRLARILIEHNRFEGIDNLAWGGYGRFLNIVAGPLGSEDVTINHNTFKGALTDGTAVDYPIYFSGNPNHTRLLITNNRIEFYNKPSVFREGTDANAGSGIKAFNGSCDGTTSKLLSNYFVKPNATNAVDSTTYNDATNTGNIVYKTPQATLPLGTDGVTVGANW